jgi:hypothetical protein
MFSDPQVAGTSDGKMKLQDHCAMRLRQLLIGLFCLPLVAHGGPTLTPAEIEARDDSGHQTSGPH